MQTNNKISTVTIITRDNAHFPVDTSFGQFAECNRPHFAKRYQSGIVRIDISADDFRPLYVALVSLPFDSTSDSYRKAMVSACAALAAAEEPLDQWHRRCHEAARDLCVPDLLDAIQRVYVRHNTYVKGRIERHAPTVNTDGTAEVIWEFEMRRISTESDAGRLDKAIDALIGGGERLHHATSSSSPSSSRPFTGITRSLFIVPGAYDRAMAYAEGDVHPDAAAAPLVAMKNVDGVELDNPFHLFAAMSDAFGWWTSAASELLVVAYGRDIKIISMVLDAEARFSGNLPRRCERNNHVCLETQLARIIARKVPEFTANEITTKLTYDYFAHWPDYGR